MANLSHLTQFGLFGIDHVPADMHACHFYSDRDQLIAALVPYAIAGLRNNERCLLVTAPPLPAVETVEALRAAWDGTDDAIRAGALRILDYDQWYADSACLKGQDVVQLWLDEEERALAEGYSGLRISGNISFLGPDDWSSFVEYEQAVTERLRGRRIIALCCYALAQCTDQRKSAVADAHHCTVERPDAGWQVVPRAGYDLTRSGKAAREDAAPESIIAYRCYMIDEDGKIRSASILKCPSDAAALEEAERKLHDGGYPVIEVWDRERRIGVVGKPAVKL